MELLQFIGGALITAGLLYSVRLFSENLSAERQAKAQKIAVGSVLGGVLLFLANPIASYLTGMDWTSPTVCVTFVPEPSPKGCIPKELATIVVNLMTLLRFIGVVVVAGGLVYAGISFARGEAAETHDRALNLACRLVALGSTIFIASYVTLILLPLLT